MKNVGQAKRPDFKDACLVFIGLALLLGGWGLVAGLFPAKSSPAPNFEPTVRYRWGRGEGRAANALFRISGLEKISLSDEPLPEKLKPFFSLPMDINRVSAALLQTVPGIGEKLANRIIRLRQEKGGFRDLAELGGIDGIGPKKLASLQAYLTCDSSPILLK